LLIKNKCPASAFQKAKKLRHLFQDRDVFNFTGQELLALSTGYKRCPSSIGAPCPWMARGFLSEQHSSNMGSFPGLLKLQSLGCLLTSCFAGPAADFFFRYPKIYPPLFIFQIYYIL